MSNKYFSFHHKILAIIGKLTNNIILCPHPLAIGNASEDYYYGIIKARKENKKLLVLFPLEMPRPFKIRMFTPAILYLESDLLAIKYNGNISYIFNLIFTIYFIVVRIIVIFLHKIFRIKSNGYYWRPLCGQDILWRPTVNQLKFDWQIAENQQWQKQFSIPINLKIPIQLFEFCKKGSSYFGLPLNEKFICLHVREGGYHGDWDNIRIADINKYRAAIEIITSKGLWVVRMGDPSMTRLPKLNRVIDYAHISSRNAMMDVYLLKQCEFMIGTSSGILDTAYMLEKPVILTNKPDWINSLPPKRGDFVIFKHVYSKKDNRKISIQEWLDRSSDISSGQFESADWSFIENSEEEIANVTLELLNYNNQRNPSDLQIKFKNEHKKAMIKLSKSHKFDDHELENCNEWYRYASKILTWQGHVSQKFLEKNWVLNSN